MLKHVFLFLALALLASAASLFAMPTQVPLNHRAFHQFVTGLGEKADDYNFAVGTDGALYIQPKEQRAIDPKVLDRTVKEELFASGLWSVALLLGGGDTYYDFVLRGDLRDILSHGETTVVNDKDELIPYSRDGKTPLALGKRAATYYEAYQFEDSGSCSGDQNLEFQNVDQCYTYSRAYASVGFRAASGAIDSFSWPHHNCMGDGAVALAIPAGQERCNKRKTYSYINYAGSE